MDGIGWVNQTTRYQDVTPCRSYGMLDKWDAILSHERRSNNTCCWSNRYEKADGWIIYKTKLRSWKNRRDL
jgi:hypothetical protein